jgi:hypothetical protein
MRILCRTKFDCSRTGVTGHFRPSEIPFTDRAGQRITSLEEWHCSRNQQRNWETLLQILSLRTQPMEITQPVFRDGAWEFEFVSDNEAVFAVQGNPDPLAALRSDCDGVPMMTGIKDSPEIAETISALGTDQNIWFETINNILD